MTWTAVLGFLRGLLDIVVGNPGQAAALESLNATRNELDRERKITATLRKRLAEKELRIREFEKLAAERDPGALLDSVFRGPAADPET